jgi:protein phosphatase
MAGRSAAVVTPHLRASGRGGRRRQARDRWRVGSGSIATRSAPAGIIVSMPASPSVIDLPEPCLAVLVGPAGSGKTTFAARHFEPAEIVSSDALREMIAGDAADQSANRAVFSALHREVEQRLAAGLTTLVDATNVERHARRALLRLAARAGRPAVAIVLDLPLDETLARNARRDGQAVPVDVVEHHHRVLARALADGTIVTEGFAAVHVLDGATDIDRARVVRG